MIYDNCFENSNVPCQKLLCKWFGSYRDEVYKEYIHAQLCLTLCNPMRVASVATRLLCPWNFPGKKTGVGCHLLLQIFSTQGLNPLLRPLHWQTDSLLLSHLGNLYKGSVQFSRSVVSDPMNCSRPGFPVHHQLPEFTQTHVHQVSDAIQPSHPLSSLSPLAPNPSQHHGLFQWVNSSHEVAKVLEW